MRIIFCSIVLAGIISAANAASYVALRAGVSDFVVDTDQYLYQSPNAYRSTIANGHISDINAIYHAAIGYSYGPARIEAEYGYANFAMSGDWALNTLNEVPGSLPPNLSYPATYSLRDRVNLFMGNLFYDVMVFGRRYGRPIEEPDGTRRRVLRGYNALYVMGGVGMAQIKEEADISVDTTMAWGGNPITEGAHNRLNRFAYSIGGGLAIGLSRDLNMDIAYKYNNLGKFHQSETRRNYALHEITAGLRYSF